MSMPFFSMFLFFLSSSTLFVLSSSHWILLWAALELNLLSLIPMINATTSFQENESSVKYFLAQALGSSILITMVFTLFSVSPQNCDSPLYLLSFYPLLLIFSLLLKLGAAPFHFWFPSVIAGASWPIAFLISTWQKISPLFILSLMNFSPAFIKLLMLVAGLSALTGGLGGLNQTQLRPLLAYSSIGHIGWMMAAMMMSTLLLIFYFLVYFLMIMPTFITAAKSKILSTKFPTWKKINPITPYFIILMLSLSGIPPLLGFLPKWLIIYSLIIEQKWLPLFLLTTGTLMNIFYYLMISLAIFYSSTNLMNKIKTNSPLLSLFVPMSVMTILIGPSVILLINIYALTIFN